MLAASPISCTASESIATLPVKIPPNSSNTEKIDTIEKISADIIAGLKAQKLSDASGNYLEDHAFAAASTIVNTQLRSMHIMEG